MGQDVGGLARSRRVQLTPMAPLARHGTEVGMLRPASLGAVAEGHEHVCTCRRSLQTRKLH